jgi:hypothetical protein
MNRATKMTTRNQHSRNTEMAKNDDIPPNAPAGGGGPGTLQSVGPAGTNPNNPVS